MRAVSCGFENREANRGSDLLVAFGPTLHVDIGFDVEYHNGNGDYPVLDVQKVEALVDTGAANSCIDTQLALTLDLPIIDQAPVAGIAGASLMNVHLAQLYCPALDHVVFGRFIAVELAAGGQGHRALIARDFLQGFKMTYDGTTGEVYIAHPDTITIPKPNGLK